MDQRQEDMLWARAVKRQHDQETAALLQPSFVPASVPSSSNDINTCFRDESVRISGNMVVNSDGSYYIPHQWHDPASADFQPGRRDINSHAELPRCIDPKMLEIKQASDRGGIGYTHTLLQNTPVNSTLPRRHYGGYYGCATGALPERPLHSQQGPHDTPAQGIWDTHASPVVESLRYKQDHLSPWHNPASRMAASTNPYLSPLDPTSNNQTLSEHDTRSHLPGDIQQTYQPTHTSQVSCTYTASNSHSAMQGPFPGALYVGRSNSRANPSVGSSYQTGNLLAVPYDRFVAEHNLGHQWEAVEQIVEHILYVVRERSGHADNQNISPAVWDALETMYYELLREGAMP